MLERYVAYLEFVKGLSQNSVKSYKSDLAEFFYYFANKEFSEITRSDIEEFIVNLAKAGNSPASRARKISSIKGIFKWALENGIIESDPCYCIASTKVPVKEAKVMTREEVAELINCAKAEAYSSGKAEDFRNLAILSFMFSSGIRRSEVVEVKISDMNLESNAVIIHGKGNKERVAYFNNSTAEIIAKYLDEKRPEISRAETSEYLFPTGQSEKMCAASINLIIDRYLKATGLKEKGYTVHDTRRAFATTVYQNTGDIVAVQRLLGHSTPSVTMRYIGANEESKRNAAMTVEF